MIFTFLMYLASSTPGVYPDCSKSECLKVKNNTQMCAAHNEILYYDRKLNVICIRGSFASDHTLRDQVRAITPRSRPLLVITSDGGLISDAMDTAEYLEKYKFDVAVTGICASACAQFVFVAAKKKYILGDGAVAMHGGPISDDTINKMDIPEQNKSNLKNENKRFIEFYRVRNIKLSLVLDAPQRILDKLKEGKIEFWIPTEKQFYDANIRNLIYINIRFRDPNHIVKT